MGVGARNLRVSQRPRTDHPDVLDLLASLVDQSLLQPGRSRAKASRATGCWRRSGSTPWSDSRQRRGRPAPSSARRALSVAVCGRRATLDRAEPGRVAGSSGVRPREPSGCTRLLDWPIIGRGGSPGYRSMRISMLPFRMTDALWRYWELRGHLAEGQSWLAIALERDRGRPPSGRRARALFNATRFALRAATTRRHRPMANHVW